MVAVKQQSTKLDKIKTRAIMAFRTREDRGHHSGFSGGQPFNYSGGTKNLGEANEPKPAGLEVNASGIPQELKALDQWVDWKFKFDESRKKKWTKVPVSPATGRFAKSTDPSTWATFDEAWAYYQSRKGRGIDGLGFMFSKADPFTGIDLDDCRNPETGVIQPWALEIVEGMDSFTELSPSGEGLHIFVKGELQGDGMNTEEIEMYDSKRYFTVTGQVYDAF